MPKWWVFRRPVQVVSPMKGAGGTVTELAFLWWASTEQSSILCWEETEFPSSVCRMWVRFIYTFITWQPGNFGVVSYTSEIPSVLKSFRDIWRQKGTDSWHNGWDPESKSLMTDVVGARYPVKLCEKCILTWAISLEEAVIALSVFYLMLACKIRK